MTTAILKNMAQVQDSECWPMDKFVKSTEVGPLVLCFCGDVSRDAVILPCAHGFGKVTNVKTSLLFKS